jgi:hypothetical protein
MNGDNLDEVMFDFANIAVSKTYHMKMVLFNYGPLWCQRMAR